MTDRLQFGPQGNVISGDFASLAIGRQTSAPAAGGASHQPSAQDQAAMASMGGSAGTIARSGGVQINAGGSYRVHVGAGGMDVQSADTSRVQMAHVSNGEAGVLGTASRDGAARSAAELKPTDQVTVAGMRTTVANAERLGFLRRDPATGIYTNATEAAVKEASGEAEAERQTTEAAKAAEEAQNAAEAARLPGEGAEEAAQFIADKVDAGTMTRAVLDMLRTDGNVDTSTLNAAASQAGVEPSAMGATLSKAMEGYTSQAEAFAASRGVDLQAFGAWATKQHGNELRQAMIGHVQNRDVSAYAPLMDRYVADLDVIDPNAILSAAFPDPGVTARRDEFTKRVVLNIPGMGEIGWTAAVRAGLVGPHRKG
jgi:hypothetical protein